MNTFLARKLKGTIILLLFIQSASHISSFEDCQQLYSEAQAFERQNNKPYAFDKYFSFCNECPDDLILLDKAYRSAAGLAQQCIAECKDPCQRYGQGTFSADAWNKYIIWYMERSGQETEMLKSNNGGKIESAVLQMGRVIVDRGLRPNGCDETTLDYSQIFPVFESLGPEYFTVPSMELWMTVLLMHDGDGKWREGRTLMNVTSADIELCYSEWNSYYLKLGEWLESDAMKNVSASRKDDFRRRHARIGTLIGTPF